MRIFNETKTIELTREQCDFTRGFLKEEKLSGGEIVLIYKLYTTKELYINEKSNLEFWFETEYREMFEKCTRKINLGILTRDGENPQQVLNNLYAQAEAKANRIHELKILIQSL